MGFLDVLFGVAEIVDALSDNSDYFRVTCSTLEVFEIGTTWKGTARVSGAGEHIETKKVWYSTKLEMPKEGNSKYTRRGILRKNLYSWVSETFANGVSMPKEAIVLNDSENCLSCEGFAKKVDDKYVITNNQSNAQFYVAYKLNVSKDSNTLGHEDLRYYFKAETTARVTSVDVKDGF